MPGTAQASVTQVFKDFGSEIIGQGVNQLFDGINNMYQQKNIQKKELIIMNLSMGIRINAKWILLSCMIK